MFNVKISCSYDGTNYHGYQIQPNALTVQEVLQNALSHVCRSDIVINGCSRTDAGVHAREYVFSCTVPQKIPEQGLKKALNDFLPKDIAILDCQYVKESFHARFDCKGKEYEYLIYNKQQKNPFLANYAFHVWYPLDEKAMDKAAKELVGTHDFKAFCCADCSVESTVRTIYNCRVERENEFVKIFVSADGFLYNMVRIISGTLVAVGGSYRGSSMKPGVSVSQILKSCDRTKAGITAPPCGLYLNRVFYDDKEVTEFV